MLNVMSVFEHQRLTVSEFQFASDFDWLLEQGFVGFAIVRQQGQWQLSVRHYIGVIRLPSGVMLEILPKIAPSAQSNESRGGQHNTARQLQANGQIENSRLIEGSRAWVQRMLTELTAPEGQYQGHSHPINSDGKYHESSLANPGSDSNNSSQETTKSPSSLKHRQLQASGQFSEHLQPLTKSVPPLPEWLLSQFIALLAHYSPQQQYQPRQQDSASLQGKLLIKQQLQRNAHQPYRFVSEISHFVPDSLSNRFIKQAWQPLFALILSHSVTNVPDHQGSAAALRGDKSNGPYSPSTQALNWSMQARRIQQQWQAVRLLTAGERSQLIDSYHQALKEVSTAPMSLQRRQTAIKLLKMAYWLLSSTQSVSSAGVVLASDSSPYVQHNAQTLSVCLFINMNHAFEQWVSLKLGQYFTQLNQGFEVQYQPKRPWLIDDESDICLTMVPDIVVRQNHYPSHVIDIKWKAIASSADISANDAYQLVAYAQAFAVNQVWLVYPYYPNVTDYPNVTGRSDSAAKMPKCLRPQLDNKAAQGLTIWLIAFDIMTGKIQSLPNERGHQKGW